MEFQDLKVLILMMQLCYLVNEFELNKFNNYKYNNLYGVSRFKSLDSNDAIVLPCK